MRSNNSTLPGWLTYALSAAFLFSAAAVLVFAYLTFRVVLSRPLNPLERSAAEVADVSLNLNQDGPPPVPTMAFGATPTLIPTNQPWEGEDRINILLMGIDRRPGGAFISRTDSMILASIDPANNTASMLSIPRDLYVVIPGYGRDRINTAFVYGSAGDNPLAGAALAMQTVEYNLGVPVHHYFMVDFSAVTNGIDALGGIDVYIPNAINDPTYPDMDYGFDPLYIPAGLQHLDGELALKYARTRHGDSDINRGHRQQQVILAARDKALGLGIASLMTRAPVLYNQLERGIRTDLSLDQLVKLANVASEVPEENIRNEVIGFDLVSSYRTEQGAAVLILDNAKATPLIQSLFYE